MAAFVGVTFSHSSKLDETAAILVDNAETQSQYITGIPGTSVASTITSTGSTQVCRVAVQGVDVWVTLGVAPVATVGGKFLVLAGTVEYFAVNKNDKIAVLEPA